jgi:hypothetical protein
MPGDSGVLVVTRVRSTNAKCTRDRGCSGHPAFPTPSLGAEDSSSTRALRAAGRERAVEFILLFENFEVDVCAKRSPGSLLQTQAAPFARVRQFLSPTLRDACIEPSLFLKQNIPASGLAMFPKTATFSISRSRRCSTKRWSASWRWRKRIDGRRAILPRGVLEDGATASVRRVGSIRRLRAVGP